MKYDLTIPVFLVMTMSVPGIIKAQPGADYPYTPVAFTQVHISDHFWAPRMRTNADVTIPYVLDQCKRTGRIDNFLRAAGKLQGEQLTSFTFDDTDIYKVIEGASYSLQTRPDPQLSSYLDTLIAIIAAAQEPDGYLYTFRSIKTSTPHEWVGTKRWEKEEDLSHELYNAGHLFEAAMAHYLATGKKNFLQIAIKNADLLVNTFGWGKEEKFPGHQIVETGLVKMYRATGKKEYLELARFFLDLRGERGHLNHEYSQAHKKVTDQHEAVGHAVRATYMYSGMADIAALTGNRSYLVAIDDIWSDVVEKKMYITGGIGATGNGEAFGAAYDLPNMSAYAETCAAIANVYWNNRMFLLHGDSKYIDVLERTLYNGLLSGISLSGDKFFYPNPLASIGQHQRRGWWDCACCVSNITRFLPSVPGYMYAQQQNRIYVNLFAGSTSVIKLPAGDITIQQNTNYPWSGKNELVIDPVEKALFSLHIRIPGWASGKPVPGALYKDDSKSSKPVIFRLNGKAVPYKIEKGYAVIERSWSKGDKLDFEFEMTPQRIFANDSVKSDAKRFSLQLGPIVYCLESPDNKDSAVMNIMVDRNAEITTEWHPELLNGVITLSMPGASTKRQANSDSILHYEHQVTAIPYYAWANRGISEMEVWIPYDPGMARPAPAPSIASKSKVSASVSNTRMYRTLNDQYEPADSRDASASYLHWWPKKNTTEWVQYDFDQPYTVKESRVYWFDDAPWGGCRLPVSYRLYYKKESEWIPVKNATPYTINKDQFDTLVFEPVTTTAMKLEIVLPPDNATGIHEWIIK